MSLIYTLSNQADLSYKGPLFQNQTRTHGTLRILARIPTIATVLAESYCCVFILINNQHHLPSLSAALTANHRTAERKKPPQHQIQGSAS